MITKLLNKLILPIDVPADKQLHAWGGMAIFLVIWAATSTPVFALATVYSAAALKEAYDYTNTAKHTPEIADIIATVLIPTLVFLFLI